MNSFKYLHRELASLSTTTELLEALNWDDDKLEQLLKELELMLITAPPSVQKALFWLRSTPWDTFDRGALPPAVYSILEKNFLSWEKELKDSNKQKMSRDANFPFLTRNKPTDYDEWN